MAAIKGFYKHLYFQVLIAIIVGVAVGTFFPDLGTSLKPLGDGFVKLIKMVIAPIIFITVVVGIAGIGDMKKLGRVGLKALFYFEVVTTFALLIGFFVVKFFQPGAGFNADPATLDAKAVEQYAKVAESQTAVDFVLHIIPSTIVGAFADGEIIQVLFFAVLFGLALAAMGEKSRPLVATFDSIGKVLFGVIAIIMRVAPIGALGAMAFTVGKYGIATLLPLAKVMICFYVTCFAFLFIVLNAIAYFNGFSIWRFIKYIKEEIFIVLGTCSSESVLPRMMAKLEYLGCSKSVVGLVIPAGYSFNLDGTSIYLTIAAIFIAQATNTQLSTMEEITILAVLMLTSKGAATVVGGAFITLAATLASLGTIPVAGLTLLLGIDRFMAEVRSVTNLVGNGVATVVIARWEGELDKDRMRSILSGETLAPDDTDGIFDSPKSIEDISSPETAPA